MMPDQVAARCALVLETNNLRGGADAEARAGASLQRLVALLAKQKLPLTALAQVVITHDGLSPATCDRGVDIGARFDIYAILRELAAKGTAIILVSSDLPELLGLADRIAVMRDGRFDTIADASGLSEEHLINLCYGRSSGALVA